MYNAMKKALIGYAKNAKPLLISCGALIMNRLQEQYQTEVAPSLFESFEFKNMMQVPRIQKVVVNIGLGEAMADPKALDAAVSDLTQIAGQKPVTTKARKSIAAFKLREGVIIGTKVTLRGERMWAFLDRLMNVALPRVRDFRGVSPNAFDGRGNYTLGLRDQLIFPEIEYDKIDKLRGMEVTIVTSAETDDQARALLQLLGMPFKKEA
jgi:large subunit ribosomal protein L5